MLFRGYIFIAVAIITATQIAFFILSWQEIYPGITYPSFSRQFNIIKIQENIICRENEFIEIFVPDLCLEWFFRHKYEESKMTLSLIFKDTSITVLPEDLFPYINFVPEKKHFSKKMLAIGTWWWLEKRDKKYAREKEQFKNSIRESGRKIILKRNKATKNSIPEKLSITFSVQNKKILTTTLPLK